MKTIRNFIQDYGLTIATALLLTWMCFGLPACIQYKQAKQLQECIGEDITDAHCEECWEMVYGTK